MGERVRERRRGGRGDGKNEESQRGWRDESEGAEDRRASHTIGQRGMAGMPHTLTRKLHNSYSFCITFYCEVFSPPYSIVDTKSITL